MLKRFTYKPLNTFYEFVPPRLFILVHEACTKHILNYILMIWTHLIMRLVLHPKNNSINSPILPFNLSQRILMEHIWLKNKPNYFLYSKKMLNFGVNKNLLK
jgi:hypothetical protein